MLAFFFIQRDALLPKAKSKDLGHNLGKKDVLMVVSRGVNEPNRVEHLKIEFALRKKGVAQA